MKRVSEEKIVVSKDLIPGPVTPAAYYTKVSPAAPSTPERISARVINARPSLGWFKRVAEYLIDRELSRTAAGHGSLTRLRYVHYRLSESGTVGQVEEAGAGRDRRH